MKYFYSLIVMVLLSTMNITSAETVDIYNSEQLTAALENYENKPVIYYLHDNTYTLTEPIYLQSDQVLMGESVENTVLEFELNTPNSCIIIKGGRSEEIKVKDIETAGSFQNLILEEHDQEESLLVEIYDDDSDKVTSDWALHSTAMITILHSNSIIDEWHTMKRNDFDIETTYARFLYPVQNTAVTNLKIINNTKTDSQTSNILIENSRNCVVSCIESYKANFSHVELVRSKSCRVVDSYFHEAHAYGGGGQGYGVTLHFASNGNLIKNNIFRKLRHSILLQAGAYGNNICSNYSREPYWTGVSLPSDAAGDIVLHGNWPHRNIIKGNVVQNIIIDNSHGMNGPHNTFLRNRIENWGFFMNENPATDSVNFGFNEIVNPDLAKGLYVFAGSGHDIGYNYVKGELKDTAENAHAGLKFETGYTCNVDYHGDQIGYPDHGEDNINTAKQRWIEGDLFECTSLITSVNNKEENTNITPNQEIKVYDILGNHIMSGKNKEELFERLDRGYYIIIENNNAEKIFLTE